MVGSIHTVSDQHGFKNSDDIAVRASEQINLNTCQVWVMTTLARFRGVTAKGPCRDMGKCPETHRVERIGPRLDPESLARPMPCLAPLGRLS